jgi:hypothetical protein
MQETLTAAAIANAKVTLLTKEERDYIVAMYKEDTPWIKNIKDISELPLGWVALFMENRDEPGVSREEYLNDHTICEKYLAFHKQPLTTTYEQWERWSNKKSTKYISPLEAKHELQSTF